MLNPLSSGDHERLSRVAAHAVAAAAAAICLILVVRIVWLVIPSADERESAGPSTTAAPAAATVSAAKWHLFGNPQGVVASAPTSSLATILKLALRGTLALPDPKDERALAIIANEQGAETSVRIGADVAPGARLSEVYADHIVIDHEGVAETLNLPRPEQHAPPNPKASPRAGSASAPAASVPPGIVSTPANGGASAAAVGTMPRIDPADVARQLKPVFADGKIVGADISGADASLLARVGLKSTDIVTAINGTPLSGVTNPQQLMDQLQNSPSVQVTVQRDGKPATLTLSLH